MRQRKADIRPARIAHEDRIALHRPCLAALAALQQHAFPDRPLATDFFLQSGDAIRDGRYHLGTSIQREREPPVGAAILSIVLNPLVFLVADRFVPKAAPTEPVKPKPSSHGRAIIVGHGRVGSRISAALRQARVEYSVIEDRQDLVERLHAEGVPAIAGSAVSIDVLKATAGESAQLIYVTVPDGFEAGRIVEIARQLNPGIRIFARSHSDAEIEHLRTFGADVIVSGEQEIALAMIAATKLAQPA